MNDANADLPMDGNPFADRCHPIWTEARLRSGLASRIRLVIPSMTLRQIDLGTRGACDTPGAGIRQADVSLIVRGDRDGDSAWRLRVLAAVSRDVSIFAQPARRRGRIPVLIPSSALRISA